MCYGRWKIVSLVNCFKFWDYYLAASGKIQCSSKPPGFRYLQLLSSLSLEVTTFYHLEMADEVSRQQAIGDPPIRLPRTRLDLRDPLVKRPGSGFPPPDKEWFNFQDDSGRSRKRLYDAGWVAKLSWEISQNQD